jgi:hypothetical protein
MTVLNSRLRRLKKSDARLFSSVIQQMGRQDAVDMFLNGDTITDTSKHMVVSRQDVYTLLKKHFLQGQRELNISSNSALAHYNFESFAEFSVYLLHSYILLGCAFPKALADKPRVRQVDQKAQAFFRKDH